MKKMSFHEPEGLAACADESGAYHCDRAERPAYARRFRQTFGFYDHLAAVEDETGWHHIRPDGSDAYGRRFQWTGNFQGGLCAVQDETGFFHIRPDGRDAYPQRFSYAGDFRYGIAVAWSAGAAFHIHEDGSRLNDQCYECAGQFHKRHAVVRDAGGWFHVGMDGREISPLRWRRAEDFYNGIALCEDGRGRVVRLRENGFYTLAPFSPAPLSPKDLRRMIEEDGACAAVFLRHAEREDFDMSATWGNDARLTEAGVQTSRALGAVFRGIPAAARCSPLLRCRRTAFHLLEGAGISGNCGNENINENVNTNGDENGNVHENTNVIVRDDAMLGAPGCFFDGSGAHEARMRRLGIERFTAEYMECGRLAGMAPLESEAERLLAHLESCMTRPLNWLVTSDIYVACLLHFAGLRTAAASSWVSFLEGVALVRTKEFDLQIWRFIP